jgi:hypothetical protein
MESDLPVRLRPQKTLDQAPGPHIVVVRGRGPSTLAAMVNPATLECSRRRPRALIRWPPSTRDAHRGIGRAAEGPHATARWALASQLERLS